MKYCNRCGAPHEPGRCGRDSEDLRTRVAAVVGSELRRQQHAIDPHRVWQWFDMGPVADAVIRELDLGVPCAASPLPPTNRKGRMQK